jgi:hypothetical protein
MLVNKTKTANKLLEMIMRDAMDGLEDATIYMNYRSQPDTVEILSIEPADRQLPLHQGIIQLSKHLPATTEIKHSTDIVAYLFHRELKKYA